MLVELLAVIYRLAVDFMYFALLTASKVSSCSGAGPGQPADTDGAWPALGRLFAVTLQTALCLPFDVAICTASKSPAALALAQASAHSSWCLASAGGTVGKLC